MITKVRVGDVLTLHNPEAKLRLKVRGIEKGNLTCEVLPEAKMVDGVIDSTDTLDGVITMPESLGTWLKNPGTSFDQIVAESEA